MRKLAEAYQDSTEMQQIMGNPLIPVESRAGRGRARLPSGSGFRRSAQTRLVS